VTCALPPVTCDLVLHLHLHLPAKEGRAWRCVGVERTRGLGRISCYVLRFGLLCVVLLFLDQLPRLPRPTIEQGHEHEHEHA
jgi:hypothetical protein